MTVPVFESAEEAEKVYLAFFEHITQHPELRPKFVEAGSSFRANYTDPDSAVSIDAGVDPPTVLVGDAARAAQVDVQLFMTADDGHQFWMGDLNIPMAMARRKVQDRGLGGDVAQAPAGDAAGVRHVQGLPGPTGHGRQAG